jgi:hypothetical protein
MRKLHLALSTIKMEETIEDYSQKLGQRPCSTVPGEYALWRTETLNLSVRQDPACAPGSLRHLGWEDSDVDEFSSDVDVNGIVWELFSAAQQADEINAIWPEAKYRTEG